MWEPVWRRPPEYTSSGGRSSFPWRRRNCVHVCVCTDTTLCGSGEHVIQVRAVSISICHGKWLGGCKVLWCDLNCVVYDPCCLCVVVVIVECGALAITNAYLYTCILIPGIYEFFGIFFVSIYNLWKADELGSKIVATWSTVLRIASHTLAAHGSFFVRYLQWQQVGKSVVTSTSVAVLSWYSQWKL